MSGPRQKPQVLFSDVKDYPALSFKWKFKKKFGGGGKAKQKQILNTRTEKKVDKAECIFTLDSLIN